MSNRWKIGVVAGLAVAIGAVIALKVSNPLPGAPRPNESQVLAEQGTPRTEIALPRLVDLGADRCIPCKKMAPILEELREDYREGLRVEFIDVWKDPAAGRRHGVRVIPTQIFYDAAGKEISRHEGFMGEQDILETFGRFGIDLHKSEPTQGE
jgi:thioredoxin 1